MSPAVPFQPGTPTTTARDGPCKGPHVRYINCWPSEVSQLGGPSLQRGGPNRRATTGPCRCAHDATVTATASTKTRAVARHARWRSRPYDAPRTAFSKTILTQHGHFPLNGPLSNGPGIPRRLRAVRCFEGNHTFKTARLTGATRKLTSTPKECKSVLNVSSRSLYL